MQPYQVRKKREAVSNVLFNQVARIGRESRGTPQDRLPRCPYPAGNSRRVAVAGSSLLGADTAQGDIAGEGTVGDTSPGSDSIRPAEEGLASSSRSAAAPVGIRRCSGSLGMPLGVALAEVA